MKDKARMLTKADVPFNSGPQEGDCNCEVLIISKVITSVTKNKQTNEQDPSHNLKNKWLSD